MCVCVCVCVCVNERDRQRERERERERERFKSVLLEFGDHDLYRHVFIIVSIHLTVTHAITIQFGFYPGLLYVIDHRKQLTHLHRLT